jgi:hypothetical protein
MFGERSLNVRPAVMPEAKRPSCPAKCRFEVGSGELRFNEGEAGSPVAAGFEVGFVNPKRIKASAMLKDVWVRSDVPRGNVLH